VWEIKVCWGLFKLLCIAPTFGFEIIFSINAAHPRHQTLPISSVAAQRATRRRRPALLPPLPPPAACRRRRLAASHPSLGL